MWRVGANNIPNRVCVRACLQLLEEREYALKEAQGKMAEIDVIFEEDQAKLDEAVRLLHDKEAELASAQEELFAQTDDIKKVSWSSILCFFVFYLRYY
jgi:uncharacterized membrane protein (DUF106 family)